MKLYACQNKNFVPFHYSSCVEETALCMGTSFCDNNEYLRQCKNKTRWENTTTLSGYFRCPGSGQQIKIGSMNDGIFDCLNRQDEEEITFNNTTSDNATQDWLSEVHKPCPNITGGSWSDEYRNGKTIGAMRIFEFTETIIHD